MATAYKLISQEPLGPYSCFLYYYERSLRQELLPVPVISLEIRELDDVRRFNNASIVVTIEAIASWIGTMSDDPLLRVDFASRRGAR